MQAVTPERATVPATTTRNSLATDCAPPPDITHIPIVLKTELQCTVPKPGMEGVDRATVNAIVLSASKGSAYYNNELRKATALEARLACLKQKAAHYRHTSTFGDTANPSRRSSMEILSRFKTEAARTLWNPETSRIFVHIDMDMFFCAVETQCDPKLASVPMAVGGNQMICTANYNARAYGVRAAMPGYIARLLCPQLVLVPPNHHKYSIVSAKIRSILAHFDPNLIMTSCDEASLDLTDYLCSRLHARHPWSTELAAIVDSIRTRVFTETNGLTCSAGIAPSRVLAKICSNDKKPNGQSILFPSDTQKYLARLNVARVPGIGRCKARLLNEGLSIHTCGELIRNAACIYSVFSEKTALFLMRAPFGLDPIEDSSQALSGPRPTDVSSPSQKSVSCDRTFTPTTDLPTLRAHIKHIAQHLAESLKRANYICHYITLKVKFADFRIRNVSTAITHGTSDSQLLFQETYPLLLRVLRSHQRPTLQQTSLAFSFGNTSLKPHCPTTRLPIKTHSVTAVRLLGLRAGHLQSQGISSKKALSPEKPRLGSHASRNFSDTGCPLRLLMLQERSNSAICATSSERRLRRRRRKPFLSVARAVVTVTV